MSSLREFLELSLLSRGTPRKIGVGGGIPAVNLAKRLVILNGTDRYRVQTKQRRITIHVPVCMKDKEFKNKKHLNFIQLTHLSFYQLL